MTEPYIDIEVSDDGIPAGSALRTALTDAPAGVIGAEFEGRLYGLEDPLYHGGRYTLLGPCSPHALELFWHSASHLLAQAVCRLFPNVKLGIGPSIRDGFYYDFDFGEPISVEELPRIEEEMRRNAAADLVITRRELSPAEARELFSRLEQSYKLELIEGIEGPISTYTQGDFTDLCRGPHLPSTGLLRHFKLLALTGAYWRGDERNPMLQRIYGTAYPTAAQLEEHLKRLEEARKRDHRLVGRQLGLFSFHPEAPGAPFWHHNGVVLLGAVQGYLSDLLARRGYQEIRTPLVLTREIWEQSGHWDHYQKNMYFTSQEDRVYALKPMNCPGAVLMFKEEQHSYRDLPLRWAEMGIVHRYEKSGVLHGLFRVRHITQDDAHIFCTPDQLIGEVEAMIKLVFEVFGHFGITDIAMELSTRPRDRIGDDALWDRAEDALAQALKLLDIQYDVNTGEGAFYGPKIDFHILDSLGRSWQMSTIQVDFNFPERFDLEYIGPDNRPHRPVMLHRAIIGSLERFIGILVEHYAGDFPLWLAPRQAVILPITDAEHDAARELEGRLRTDGFRCHTDFRAEKIGRKIRDAELDKIPYMLVVGAREAADGQVSLRRRGEGDLGVMSTPQLVERMRRELTEAKPAF